MRRGVLCRDNEIPGQVRDGEDGQCREESGVVSHDQKQPVTFFPLVEEIQNTKAARTLPPPFLISAPYRTQTVVDGHRACYSARVRRDPVPRGLIQDVLALHLRAVLAVQDAFPVPPIHCRGLLPRAHGTVGVQGCSDPEVWDNSVESIRLYLTGCTKRRRPRGTETRP